MILRGLVILLILKLTFQECSIGCLKCSEDDECEFCDILRFYKLENKTCIKVESENCLQIDAQGQCQSCLALYYLDSGAKKCVKVEKQFQIKNCLNYSTGQQCTLCKSGYYIRSNECVKIENEEQILNCEYYQSPVSCLQCFDQFVLSQDQSECLLLPGIPNCGFYQRGFCTECKEGYYLNYEYETEEVLKFSTRDDQIKLSSHLNEVFYSQKNTKFSQSCEKISLENCMFPITAKVCARCDLGFYKTKDHKCERFPFPIIPDCRLYLSFNICKECENGFYIKKNDECAPTENIDQCQLYDGTAKTTKCLQCIDGYYSTGNTCNKRVQSLEISNCQEKTKDKDRCNKCQSGYIISSDGLKCFTIIKNCKEYTPTNSRSKSITCARCEEGLYYADMQGCVQGQIQNCGYYENSMTNCTECKNGYYLQQSLCQQHETQAFCEIYSPTLKNICQICESNYYNFRINKICKSEIIIDNCIEYQLSTPVQCTKCAPGFYVDNNICKTISQSNCSLSDGTNCQGCYKDYALDTKSDTTSKCSSPFQFYSNNCLKNNLEDEVNTKTMEQVACSICESGTIPIDMKEQYVCVKNDKLSAFGFSPDKINLNCLKYKANGDCVQCVKNFFIQNGKCVDKCQSGVYRLLRHIKEGSGSSLVIYFDGYNECVESQNPSTDGREILGIDVTAADESKLDIILKCKDEYQQIVYSLNLDFSNLDYTKQPIEYGNNIMKKFPGIAICQPPTINSPLIQNCEYYAFVEIRGQFLVRCLKCKAGFHGKIFKDYKGTNKSVEAFYMNECEPFTGCQNNYKDGLNVLWEKYYSCHFCQNSIQIPFLALSMESNKKPIPKDYQQYNLQVLDRTIQDENRYNIECLIDQPSSFGYQTVKEKSVYQPLPTNCALGVLNLSINDGNSTNNQRVIQEGTTEVPNLAHFCAACKGGFKGVALNQEFFYIKVQCAPIENCQGQEWFNNCSECKLGYAFGINSGLIDFTKCVAQKDPNCFASSDTGICVTCKKGYNLNDDFACETLKPENCKSSDNFIKKIKYSNKLNYYYGVYHDSQGIGCNQCVDGYSGVQLTESFEHHWECVRSPYLQKVNTEKLQTDTLVQDCETYGIFQGIMICQKCKPGFVPNLLRSKCFDTLTNCMIAENKDKCIQCEPTYGLVNNKCIANSIDMCFIPDSSNNSSTIKCILCFPNHYLTKDYKCKIGFVLNCLKNIDYEESKCEQCLEGFALFKNPDGADFCYKIDESLQCTEADIQSNQQYGGEIGCTKCKEPYQFIQEVQPNSSDFSRCLPFAEIENCIKYEKKSELKNSTLNCLQCKEGYFLLKGIICIERTNFSKNCIKYFDGLDGCEICDAETFLIPTGDCYPKPSGIVGCINYENPETCTLCNEGLYLENNQCLKLEEDDVVENCTYHQTKGICFKCKDNYYADGNTCVVAEAQNCLTYLSASRCENCMPNSGKGLVEQDNGVVSCLSITKPNCVEVEYITGQPCKICSRGYYPEDGVCKQVSSSITNCLEYQNSLLCSKCDLGFALQPDKKSCVQIESIIEQKDENCINYKNELNCSQCRPGSIFSGGTCTKCFDSIGCYKCDTFTLRDCLMCQSGYYMNKKQKCIKESSNDIVDEFEGIGLIFKSMFGILFIVLA